jgi:hypothetical protein
MDPSGPMAPDELDAISRAFNDQLLACLNESARGRRGLFSESILREPGTEDWPQAARLRELAVALQAVFAQHGERSALCDEFLDLCSMHGEYDPGEQKLARSFLARIEGGQVGTPRVEEKKSW